MKCAHGHKLVLEVPVLVNYWNYYSNDVKLIDATKYLRKTMSQPFHLSTIHIDSIL
jgi:hypothetical protein